MSDTFRALCAELLDWLDSDIAACRIRVSPAAIRARAALAEGEAGLSDEELFEWFTNTCRWLPVDIEDAEITKAIRAVLARYGSTPPRPIPVSERLPGPEDCNTEGRCWWFDGTWMQKQVKYRGAYSTHWLPAHAIPTPENTDD